MDRLEYDVIVIGAGVTGSAVARELAKRERRIAVLERESDVCEGTSKANSGIAHAGFDAQPGTLKAKLNVQGAKLMKELSETLDFPYRQNGSIVVSFEAEGMEKLQELYMRGQENGVEGLRILTGDE
ncbi:MAG: FAD-dependent oxidoreductase, partial [Lachnospiraceae bacterium]|nr:FAD-dependent oxidoreductase [Lachnospiraceae bacterium]